MTTSYHRSSFRAVSGVGKHAPEFEGEDRVGQAALSASKRRQKESSLLRALHPGERIYTFWKYFRNAFGRDAELRIDHLLLSPPLAKRLTVAGVDREVRGREHASDHAPAWIELAEPTKASPRRARRLNRES
jgi:exonuclease III